MTEEEKIKAIYDLCEKHYDALTEKPKQVLDIFNDFFGCERVDMQGLPSLLQITSWFLTNNIDQYFSHVKHSIDSLSQNLYRKMPLHKLPTSVFNDVIERLHSDVLFDICDAIYDTNIIVHFPHVTVTNENGKSIEVSNLWAKVRISHKGYMVGYFALNRSEYPLLQYDSGYMHSHCPGINKSDFTSFLSPCTGAGPINATMSSLHMRYDEDIWNLFCLELSKYVTIESLSGGPHRYLERVKYSNNQVEDTYSVRVGVFSISGVLEKEEVREFIDYFIKEKKLKFNYIKGSYSIAMSDVDYIILISNAFIDWYNKKLLEHSLVKESSLEDMLESQILKKCTIDNNTIYYRSSVFNDSYKKDLNKAVLLFKDREIRLNITNINGVNENEAIIINPNIAFRWLTSILRVLNYRYGNSNNTCTSSSKVRYL